MRLEIPDVLRREHRELHLRLQSATVLTSPVGEAARNLTQILQPHLLREEQFVFPLLSLLPHLAVGRIGPDMAVAVPIAERLRAEMPRLREEHVAMFGALEAFAEAAREEKREDYRRLAYDLIEHSRMEEAIVYPAAMVVGDYVRLSLEKNAPEKLVAGS
jgi:hypothetical protein